MHENKERKCVICAQKKGERICRLRNNEIVCSFCCAEIRSLDCEDCRYYVAAKRYAISKTKKPEPKHFIVEINEEVEDAVDQALALVEGGDVEKGEFIISKLRNKHPRNHTVYFGLGIVCVFKKRYDEAIGYFDQAIDIFPYYVEAHFNKGVACKEKLDIANTIKSFQKVVAIGDQKDEFVRQAKEFVDDFEQHLNKEGISLEAYLENEKIFKEAFFHLENKEWRKALARFEACLAINEKHPQSHGNMGICYAHLGQKQKAIEALDRAIEIDPSYEPAIMNRMVIESFNEGDKLDQISYQSIEYYKDYPLKKKSYIRSIIEKLLRKKIESRASIRNNQN